MAFPNKKPNFAMMLGMGKPKPVESGPPDMAGDSAPDPGADDAATSGDGATAEMVCPSCGDKIQVTLAPAGGGAEPAAADAGVADMGAEGQAA